MVFEASASREGEGSLSGSCLEKGSFAALPLHPVDDDDDFSSSLEANPMLLIATTADETFAFATCISVSVPSPVVAPAAAAASLASGLVST